MRIVALFVLLTLSIGAVAIDYNKDINNFFVAFKTGDVDSAVDELYSSNPYVSALPDQIKVVKTQLGSLPGLAGEIQSISKMDEYVVNESLAHITYLVIYDRMPAKFEFQYFKVSSGWRIFSFSFDDSVFDMMEPDAQERAFSEK